MHSWGDAEVYFDEEARSKIGRKELAPSPEAKNIYFYIDGFQDHTIFIAFTDTPERIDKAVFELTGKHVSELSLFDTQLDDDWSKEPGAYDKKLLTSLYDVDVIKKGRFYSFQSDPRDTSTPAHGWHLIVDEETSRLYYCSWDT